MATNLNLVRTLTIRAKTEGVDQATASVKRFGETTEQTATASVKMEKATLSNEAALKRLERQVDSAARAQANMAKALKTVEDAQNRGTVTQARANELMQLSLKHFNSAEKAAGAHAKALEELSRHATSASSQLGSMGAVLGAIGPIGLAVAAALGAMTLGFKAAADAALALAEQSGKLIDLSDTVGLTVKQLQALEIAGAQVGLSSETVGTSLEKFSSSLAQIRSGAGGAVDTLERLNPGLVEQIQNAKSASAAFDLITAAMSKMDSAEKSLLSKEIFGKGGTGFGRLADATAAAGGIEKLTAGLKQIDLLTREQASRFDDLGDAINENFKLAGRNATSAFAGPTLEALKSVSDILLDISRIVKLIGTPLAEAFAGPALTSLQSFKKELEALVTLIQSSSEGDRLKIVADEFIDPRLIQTIVDFIELLKQLILTIGLAAQAVDRFTGLDFAGAKQSATAAMQAVSNFGTAVSNLKRTLSGELPATGSGVGLPSIDVLGNKADEAAPKLGKVATATKEAGKAALDYVDILRNNVSALGDAATETEKYQLKVAELAKKLQEGTISQSTFNRAVAAINPTTKALQDTVKSLGDAMATAFINGQSAADALHNSLKSIATTAASATINNLIKGDFGAAAVSGTVAVGSFIASKLFGGSDPQAEQRKQQAAAQAEQERLAREKQIADAQVRAAEFSLRAAEAMEKSDFAAQIRRFDMESQKAFDAESKAAGDVAIWQLVAARAAERTKLIADTIDAATSTLAGAQLSEVQTRLQEINDAASTLTQALQAQGMATEDVAAAVNDKLNPALAQLKGSFIDDITRQVNELAGGDWINQADDLAKKVTQMRGDAAALGIQTNLIDEFYIRSAANIAEQNNLTGDSFKALEAQLGFAPDELANFARAIQNTADVARRSADQLATASQALSMRLLQATTDTSSLSGALAVFDAQAGLQRAEEIKAGGELLAQLDQTLAAERLQIQQNFAAQALQQQKQAQDEALRAQQQAAEEQARIIKEAQDFLEGQLRRISDWIAHFQASAQSNLSPSAQLAAAQSAFQTQRTQALGGNRDALSNITGYAQDVVDAVRRYYGSGAAGQTIVDQLIGQLQALPTQVSAEQFIVNAIEAQTEELALRLVEGFDTIDTNTDGLITFDEMQTALGGMYNNPLLHDMFTRLDTDNSGSISRLEAISGSTGSTALSTSSISGAQSSIVSNTANAASQTGAVAANTSINGGILGEAITTDTSAATSAANLVTANATLASVRDSTAFLNSINNNIIALIAPAQATASEVAQIRASNSVIAAWQSGQNHAMGGWITGGTQGRDSVRANLTPGEFVVREPIARSNPWLADFNSTGIMPMYGAANDNGSVVMAIQAQTVALMRGIAALIQAELQAAGIISRPIEEANKLQRTRRGEKKAA